MRLIDADALMKYIDEKHSYAGLPMAAHICTMELLTYAPTIEAEPVKHGRWENWKPPHLGMEYSYDLKACSECGFAMHNALLIPAHYCPHCGARMDGEPNG